MDNEQKLSEQAPEKAEELRIRLLTQVREFEQGHSSVLLKDDFVRNVAQLIVKSSPAMISGHAAVLLELLGKHACGEDHILRQRAVMALCVCSQLLSPQGNYALLSKVTFLLTDWLKCERSYQALYDTVCRQLQQNGLRMLEEGHWQDFAALQDRLFHIQATILEKEHKISALIAKTQDLLAAPYILEELAQMCLSGEGARQALAEKILSRLGRRSVTFLLKKLLLSQQKTERLQLIKLLSTMGKIAGPVFKAFLAKELPWYGVRNIILLITAIGDSSLVPLVLPSLNHADIRVQQQVIECIAALAGVYKKKYFLAALSLVNDELKAGLIVQLGELGIADCADVLLDLLEHRDTITKDVRDEILSKICIVLRQAPQPRSIVLLQQPLAEREQQGLGNDPVALIARRTLRILEPQLEAAGQPGTDEKVNAANGSAAAPAESAGQASGILESQIQQLLQEGKITELTALIAEHAMQAVNDKNFVTAESLRDQMLTVNPNALIEVIRVSEAIEEAKSNAISSHHLSLWSDLYDFLDTEEFSALYHCQHSREYQAEEVIVQQGAANPTLYFINAGVVALTCKQGQKDIFLKRLKAGEIIGVGPFFDVSLWTVTLTAMTTVKLQILERQDFQKLLIYHPGLELSLADFCRRSDTVAELLKIAGESRRQDIRHPAQGIIVNNLLDVHGNPSPQKFKAQLADISPGGLSFVIRISKKENARLLLGRQVVSFIPTGSHKLRESRGQIVGVSLQDYVDKDYRVHVRFEQSIEPGELQAIVRQWRQ